MTGTRILPDKSVLFEFHYYDADWVGVAGSFNNWEPWPMQRAEGGVWYLRTPPLEDGEYEYKFVAGGQYLKDQFNVRDNWDGSNSVVKVGWGCGQLFRHHFYSYALGREMPYCVYLPPSYYTGRYAGYPVLYLQAGLMDGCQDWSVKGGFEHIMDEMIGSGQIPEMVVACNEKDDACFHPNDWPRYARYLSEDFVGHIESEYAVSSHPLHRAIDGLSLGAGWSLRLGAWRPDFYTSVGALSGSAAEDVYQSILNNRETIEHCGTRYQIVVGYAEGDIVPACTHFHEFLQSQGIPSVIHYREGDHDWPLWRDGLRLNLLFHGQNFSRG